MIMNISMTRKKGTSWTTALRLNTLLLTEFRNNLIQTLNEQERGTMVVPPHGIELKELN